MCSLTATHIKGAMSTYGIFKTQWPRQRSYLIIIIWEFMLRIKEVLSFTKMTKFH